MSAVPPPYYPEASFATQAQQPIVTAGLPGVQMDAEFVNIQTTVNAVRSRLSQIQRDDGNLRNATVSIEGLTTDVIEMIAAAGHFTLRGLWQANTAYDVWDVFMHNQVTRLVFQAYNSEAEFGGDENNSIILGQPPDVGNVFRQVFDADGSTSTFVLSEFPVSNNNLRVFLNGLFQIEGLDYSLSGGNQIVFTNEPAPSGKIMAEVGTISIVGVADIADNSITGNKLVSGTIQSGSLASQAVTSDKVADSAITSEKLATSAVTTAKIENGSVTNEKMALNAISGDKIQDGAVTSAKIDSAAVTTTAIATGAVSTSSLADNAVTEIKITDGSVSTAKINDAAVTTPKLADGAATTVKIADTGVTAAKLSGSQTGAAPVFGARAWATINGTSAANKTGTYTQTGTVATISVTAHGLRVGHSVFCDFTSGTATDADFTVATVIDANNFTVTRAAATTSGNVTLNFVTIVSGGNISSVSKTTAGDYCLNFTEDMPNANYALTGNIISNSTSTGVSAVFIKGTSADITGPVFKKTVSTIAVIMATSAGAFDHTEATVVIFG